MLMVVWYFMLGIFTSTMFVLQSCVVLPFCLAKNSKSFNPYSTKRWKKEFYFHCFSVFQMCFSFAFHRKILLPRPKEFLRDISLSWNTQVFLEIIFHYIDFKDTFNWASTLCNIYTTLRTSERIEWHLIFKIYFPLNWLWAIFKNNKHLIEHISNSNIYSSSVRAWISCSAAVKRWGGDTGNVNTIVSGIK